MVECNFCGKEVDLGRGKLYAKKDGTSYLFCSGKCEKNLIVLKRKPVKIKWTNAHHKLKKTLALAKDEKKEEKGQKTGEGKK